MSEEAVVNHEVESQQQPEPMQVDVQELAEIVSQLYREKAESKLRKVWGEAYESNYERVQKHLQTLPPAQQQMYNSVEGAEFIAWKLGKENPVPDSEAPVLDKSTVAGGSTPAPMFKLSELRKMSPAEKRAKDREINEAYRLGLIERDI